MPGAPLPRIDPPRIGGIPDELTLCDDAPDEETPFVGGVVVDDVVGETVAAVDVIGAADDVVVVGDVEFDSDCGGWDCCCDEEL